MTQLVTHLSSSIQAILFSSMGANVAAVCIWHIQWHSEESVLLPRHHIDIQLHRLHVMIRSLSFLPSLPNTPSWALRETIQAAAAAALLSYCYGCIPLPLSPWGTADNTWSSEPETASSSTAREPSASADIFQGTFQQMEFLQVPFGVKFLAWGYSIWSITY